MADKIIHTLPKWLMTLSNNEICLDMLVTSIGSTRISLAVNLPWLSSINTQKKLLVLFNNS